MSIEFLIEGEMEFDDVLINDRKINQTNIPIVYFMVHSNGSPFRFSQRASSFSVL